MRQLFAIFALLTLGFLTGVVWARWGEGRRRGCLHGFYCACVAEDEDDELQRLGLGRQ